MAKTFLMQVVSVEGEIFKADVRFAVLPSVSGEMGVYPNHAPVLALLKPGVVRLLPQSEAEQEIVLVVSGGIVEVQAQRVLVLADTVIRAKEIDEQRVQQAEQEARVAMDQLLSSSERRLAAQQLALLQAQISALRRLKSI